ncbi:Uncharacterized protein FKW44_003063, partial [Caligus rogercresseyi]
AILVSAAARYATFSLKIPSVRNNSWTIASEKIKYFLSSSLVHLKILRRILKISK